MIAVITGDIINSQKADQAENWIKKLKGEFSVFGKHPKDWDIYRGDSFQLIVKNPEDALYVAYKIKTCIKAFKELDVRMAIGIGEASYLAPRVTESNGKAFVFSGQKFESLKEEKLNLAIRTNWKEFDEEINLLLKLALIAMDNWKPASAELVKFLLENQELSQTELGEKLKISQSSVSERQKRAHFVEIMEVEKVFRKKIANLIS